MSPAWMRQSFEMRPIFDEVYEENVSDVEVLQRVFEEFV